MRDGRTLISLAGEERPLKMIRKSSDIFFMIYLSGKQTNEERKEKKTIPQTTHRRRCSNLSDALLREAISFFSIYIGFLPPV